MSKCKYPDRKCPNMETQDNTCLLRNPFDCPMSEQDELLLTEIANEILPMTKTEAYRGWQIRTAKRVLAKAKQHYEQERRLVFNCPYPEERDCDSCETNCSYKRWLEQERLDRLELREKIEEFVGKYNRWQSTWSGERFTMSMLLDQIIVLIPDMEEAKKQERERILKEIESHALVGENSFSKTVLFEGCIEIRPSYPWWQALKRGGKEK